QGWAKKILFILTKKDIKEPRELDEIRAYVSDNVKKYFDFDPLIFTVSAKQAREAKAAGDNDRYRESGFAELEEYLFKTLSEGEKLQLKLESPVNSAISICDRAIEQFTARLANLKDDRKVLETIRQQLEQSEADMSENFGRFILEIDNIVYDLEKRGRNWVDDNVKITNAGMLRSAERFRARFKEDVVRDFEQKIDETLGRSVDWFMKKYLKVWQDTTEYFADQAAKRPHEGMVGKVGSKFEYNREKIYELVRADARDKVRNFDYEDQIRQFLGRSATGVNVALGGSLVGIGAAVTVALVVGTTLEALAGGIGGGVFVAGASMLVLPMQRKKIKANFSDKCTQLRAALTAVLDQQIKREAKEAVDRIRESFGPFFDYVGRTSGAVEEAMGAVKKIRDDLNQLKVTFAATLKEEAAALNPPLEQPAPADPSPGPADSPAPDESESPAA
ncbi:MAG: hypothetical protein KJ044_03515, partial [Planctomycetes bacterium]|nr:hypothetical protein [Planctomycetota bacterium]